MTNIRCLNDSHRFSAPEVDLGSRNSGTEYYPYSDVWSTGLVMYYIATGGQCPFESHRQAGFINGAYLYLCLVGSEGCLAARRMNDNI